MDKIEFNKPKAKHKVEITPDYSMDKDGLFYKISYIEKKTEKVAHQHCVIKSDLDNWIRCLEKEGWIKQ
jgi:hypothetical protein